MWKYGLVAEWKYGLFWALTYREPALSGVLEHPENSWTCKVVCMLSLCIWKVPSGLCWEGFAAVSQETFPLFPLGKAHMSMSILIWSYACVMAFFGMTVALLVLFWMQRCRGGIFMSCQTGQELSIHEAALEDLQPYCLTSGFYRLRVQSKTARHWWGMKHQGINLLFWKREELSYYKLTWFEGFPLPS